MTNPNQQSLFDQIKDSALEGLKPRIQDPFVSVYSVSFLIWNYQIFIFAFSNLDAQAKYTSIRDSLDAVSFLTPVIPVILINFLFPWALLSLYKLSESLKIDLSNALNTVRAKHYSSAMLIARLEGEIDDLRQRISEKEQRISDLDYKSKKSLEDLDLSHQTETVRTNQKHNKIVSSLQEKVQVLETEVSDSKKTISDLKNENALLQPISKSTAPLSNEEVENTYAFLKRNNLINAFQDLYERVSTTNTFYKQNADTKYLAKFLAKGLFILEQVPTEFDTTDVIVSTDLGKEVYAELLENLDTIPF